MSDKSFMHGGGESCRGVAPTKQPNKGEGSPAEVVEGRPLTKENTQRPNSCRTPSRKSELNGLARVREAAASNDRPYRDPDPRRSPSQSRTPTSGSPNDEYTSLLSSRRFQSNRAGEASA